MARKSPYPAEMRARAVRMVGEVRPNYDNEYAAIKAVAARLSIGSAETLRKWVRRAEVDAGTRPGITTGENEQDGTEVEYVQVHPDTDSFENHMRVVERSGRSYTETLEGTTNIRIYGTPQPGDPGNAKSGSRVRSTDDRPARTSRQVHPLSRRRQRTRGFRCHHTWLITGR